MTLTYVKIIQIGGGSPILHNYHNFFYITYNLNNMVKCGVFVIFIFSYNC